MRISRRFLALNWYGLIISKIRWDLFIVDRATWCEPMRSSFGLTEFGRHEILIAADQPLEMFPETTLHELEHAADGKLSHEKFIRRTEKPLCEAITQLGFKLPPFPEGFEEFRKRAIANQRRSEWLEAA